MELPQNKTSEKADETDTKIRELFSRELGVNEDDYDYELDKAHRLPINSTESNRRNSPQNNFIPRKKRFTGQLIEK